MFTTADFGRLSLQVSKFQERQLPTKEAFFSQLTEEHISDEDYQHAQTVFTTFKPALLLADVFENFRSLNYYGLYPAHYYTSPVWLGPPALRWRMWHEDH